MDSCSLCCEESKAWAIGHCEHAMCLGCSVRLRVLCDQRDCPVCREKLNKVRVASPAVVPSVYYTMQAVGVSVGGPPIFLYNAVYCYTGV